MYAEFLPVLMDNAEIDADLLRPEVISGTADLRHVLSLCRTYGVRGIGFLLTGEPVERMQAELAKSGRAYLHFLRGSAEKAKATGRGTSFFDAIAAGDLECAREISRHSRPTHNPDGEYEEAFLYVFLLMKRFFLNGSPAECRELLQRYEEALDGLADPRLEICRALLDGDARAFGAALSEHLERAQAAALERIAAGMMPQEQAATEAHLSVEGLALVRLAEAVGLPTDPNYATVPSLARSSAPTAFPADAWMAS